MSKIAIVTDTHLSVRNDLESLMDYQNRFWKDHFFPELKKKKIKEIFHLMSSCSIIKIQQYNICKSKPL